MLSNPTTTVSPAIGHGIVNNVRARLGRKSETFSELLDCPMTVGQGAGMVLSGAVAVLLASAGVYGWAACLAQLAWNCAAPGVRQFIREGGEA